MAPAVARLGAYPGDCWDPGSDSTGNPFSEVAAASAQAQYSEGTKDEVLNIAGDGIMLHFDTGFTCSNHSLCGAWGGGGSAVTEPDHDNGDARVEDSFRHVGPGTTANPASYFKYMQVRPTGGKGGYGGLDTDFFAAGLYYLGGTARCTTPTIKTGHAISHEMGHSNGLGHNGAATWVLANCKAHYRSLMNYSFDDQTGDGTGWFHFSHGVNSSHILNAATSVYESAVLYPTDASYLIETASTSFNQYPNAQTNGSVDFNRDRFIGDPPSGRVRATVADTLLNGQCYAGFQNFDFPPAGTNLSPISPAAINFRGRLYAFWIETDPVSHSTTLKYSQASHTGADGKGGCTLGSGGFNTSCHSFASAGTVSVVPVSPGVQSISTTEWNDQIVLVYRDANGVVWATATGTVDPSGYLSSWLTPAPVLPSGTFAAADDVTVSPMFVLPTTSGGTYPSNRVLGVFVRIGTALRWYWSTAPTAAWTMKQIATGANPIVSSASVAVWPNRCAGPTCTSTGWPADYADVGFACGLYVETVSGTNRLGFMCYNKTSDSWNIWNGVFLGGRPPADAKTPRIAYHTLREGNNPQYINNVAPPLTSNNTWVQYYMAYAWAGHNRMATSSRIRQDIPPTSSLVVTSADFADDGTALTMVEDGDLSALKGAQVIPIGNPAQVLYFFSFIDGTWNTDMKDGNDFYVMERGICAALFANGAAPYNDLATRCGLSNPFGY